MVSIIHFWVHLHGIAVDKASIMPDCEILMTFRKRHCLYLCFTKIFAQSPPEITADQVLTKVDNANYCGQQGKAASCARKKSSLLKWRKNQGATEGTARQWQEEAGPVSPEISLDVNLLKLYTRQTRFRPVSLAWYIALSARCSSVS